MKREDPRCISIDCQYKENCQLQKIKSTVVYDYSYTCNENSEFEYYISNNNDEVNYK